ncbi:hypothetical protein EJG51_011360 [Undibacterium piscinae]|jgi:hypothetical protein|uniref:Fibronectin type-III domain-containing protein n=1 Tax=Undibacterium piscinae TaxID=2495591 RepID=A0A6M4A6Z0_9BURK|nr:hypothetical protein EJG51_011360 [Undibacterium piscinae]
MNNKKIAPFFYALLLAACGGGSGSDGGSTLSPIGSGLTPPAAISAASTANSSESTVTLSWQPVNGANSYEIWRSIANASGADATPQLVKRSDQTSFTDSGLIPATSYVYSLKSCMGNACSGGFEIKAKTLGKPLALPARANAPILLKSEDRQISFSWANVSGATGYRLQRNDGWEIANGAQLTQTTYTDTGLTAATSYIYRVQACNSSGCSEWSEAFTTKTTALPTPPVTPPVVTPPVLPIPAVPAPPTATVAGADSINVAWTAVNGASRYVLMRNNLAIGGNTLTAVRFLDSGLSAAVSFSYTVQACNNSGCSAASGATIVKINTANKIILNVSGLDTSLNGNVALSMDGYENGRWVRRTETISGNGSVTSNTTVETGQQYGASISAQPANGQTCNTSPNGRVSTASGGDVSIVLNCLTPATLSFASASQTMLTDITNDMAQLATVKNSAAKTITTGAVRYSSSNTTVAQVNVNTGAITALQPGTATISASLPANLYTAGTASYTLTVAKNLASTRLRAIDIAQVLAQRPGSAYQILVPGRDVLVRAYLYAISASDKRVPQVLLSVRGNATEIAMTCPATLPLDSGAVTPSYTLAQTCNATLPAALVKNGMQIDVRTSDGQTLNSAPAMNDSNTLKLTLIPLKINAHTAQMPSSADVSIAVRRTMPFTNVQIGLHAEWTPNGTWDDSLTSSGSGSDQWGKVLGLVDALRISENADGHYYGFVPNIKWSSTAGIGYVGGPTAIGLDMRDDADLSSLNRTMIHELGHTLSLSHAPCGGVARFDPFFTSLPLAWPNSDSGQLSEVPLYNQAATTLETPGELGNRNTDIMAYCSGLWFSEYSYHKMARYIQGKNSYGSQAIASAEQMLVTPVSGQRMMLISGNIATNGSVNLEPVHLLGTRHQASAAKGDYQLRIISQDGNVILQRFAGIVTDHDSAIRIAVVLPAVANIASIDVLKDGKALLTRPQTQASALKAAGNILATSRWTNGEFATAKRQGNKLQIRWDNHLYPWMSAVYISVDGKRSMLSLNATGGSLDLPVTPGLAGGSFEISLSDGLNAVIKTIPF